MNIDLILQTVMTAVLLATGGGVWRASVALARLAAELEAHDKLDEVRFTILGKLIEEKGASCSSD